MRFLSSLAVAVSLNAIVALAGPDTNNWGGEWSWTYGSGNDWQDPKQQYNQHIWNACHGYIVGPGIPGHHQDGFYEKIYFQPWNSSPYAAQLCVPVDSGGRMNVEIANLNPGTGFYLNNDDCYNQLLNLWYMPHGGELQTHGWWYRMEPNNNRC